MDGQDVVLVIVVVTALWFAAVILAGLLGAILWNLLTWRLGLPSSSSHALFLQARRRAPVTARDA
jgi:phosphate/sulfate permease